GNLVAVKLDFCVCHFHPGLLHQNRLFCAMSVNFTMLKFFLVKFDNKPENWILPKILRLRKNFVLNGRLMAKCAQKYGLSTVALF
ncbi:MAG TPA: hypothetical protein VKA34_08665, partial [Balneolales bacterium]|nr:hypothetical protein [Balneolales bacterium]